MGNQMSNPLFVAISDVHYTVSNLELCDKAFRLAIDKAAELNVPLIDCGDITNDKAVLRGEVANRLIKTMNYATRKNVFVILLVGNHSLINEKGKEHVLNFLSGRALIVDCPQNLLLHDFYLIPYQNTSEAFTDALQSIPKGSIVVCHQGVKGAFMGDYVQDKTNVDPNLLKDWRIFSGHYHRHQTIGTLTYIGSPFTHTFGEANDGPKGFIVVNEDGSFTREILDLRKHIILEGTTDKFSFSFPYSPDDLLWVKLRGPESELKKVKKKTLGDILLGHSNFKLDLIPTEKDKKKEEAPLKPLTSTEVFDNVIDSTGETLEQKNHLKSLWKDLINEG